MSALNLDAIRARLDAAAPEPWEPGVPSDSIIAPADRRRARAHHVNYYGGPVVGESMQPSDRAFIIAARTDVPALLAEVDQLRTLLVDLEDENGDCALGWCPPTYPQCATCRARAYLATVVVR